MSGPLTGLKILDFTHVLAGPFATRVFGDMGADVVKINSTERAVGANGPHHPYYLMWNRNKRALALNMSEEDSRKICRALCETADVVIDNFSVGVLDRWGVGYDAVSKVNKGVIYVQMSGMGDGGPWSKYVTYAPTIHALSGLTHLTGVPGRDDIGIGFSYNDHQAGLHGAVAVLAALEAKHRRGTGQRVDISQFEVGVNMLGPTLLDHFANDTLTRSSGNHLPYDEQAPHGCYPCFTDESLSTAEEPWIAIACHTDEEWQQLCKVMGNPEWSTQSDYQTATGRYAARETLDKHIADWTKHCDATELMHTCQQAGIPAGLVQTGLDLAENDPQLQEANFLRMIEDIHPEIGVTWADKLPISFHRSSCDQYERVRAIGEDNAAVLGDWLGMSEEEVRAGEDKGLLT